MTALARSLRFGVLQLKVGKNKRENVENAIRGILNMVKESKPRVIALPECFNCPYGTKYFGEYSESIPDGYTCQILSHVAKEQGIYLIGGTIPEKDNGAIYNTCTVWSPTGDLIGKHRKMHLFDIDIVGGVRFKESEVLSAGNDFTMVNIDGVKVGIGICYDIRFEEMARIYRNEGCEILVYPGAFNMSTGPLHWELLARSRANDNQLFVAVVSVARDESADYIAWGHSMIVDPWGKVVDRLNEKEGLFVVDMDLSLTEKVRQQIPTSFQRRTDIYSTERKVKEK